MELPFTADQFEAVFVAYNQSVWPIQLLAWALGFVAVLCVKRGSSFRSSRAGLLILALFWFWTGVAYHINQFARINPAAFVFGAAFVVQATLLVIVALRTDTIRLQFSRGPRGLIAAALILYGLVIYPLAALLGLHVYPATPMFGTTPCPTVIFTFGMLLLARPGPPLWLFLIPTLWAVVGGSAAVLLNVPEDWLLLAAGASWLLVVRPGKPRIPC